MSRLRLKRIHVNQQKIRQNIKKRKPEPVVIVRRGAEVHYGFEVDIVGNAKMVYRPHKPLSCGARLWIETYGRILIDGVPLE